MSPKINCYETDKDSLIKSFCKLSKKCYYSGLKTRIVTTNKNYTQELDRILWTYSRKNFVPHGTCFDEYSESHPIYITHESYESRFYKEKILFFFNVSIEQISTQLKDNIQSHSLNKMLFLFDRKLNISSSLSDILLKTGFKNKIEFFIQSDQETWRNITK